MSRIRVSRLNTAKDGSDVRNDLVLAGAAEVGGKAASIASSFGSFLGSKLNKPRSHALETASIDAQPVSKLQDASSPVPSSSADDGAKPKMSFFSGWRSTSSSSAIEPGTSAGPSVRPADAQRLATPPMSPPAERASSPVAGIGSFLRRASGALSPPADSTGSGGTSAGSSFFGAFAKQQGTPPASRADPSAASVDDFEEVLKPKDLDAQPDETDLRRLSVGSTRSDGGTKMSEVTL